MLGRRFAAALIPRLFGKNPRSHHKGPTGRVRTGNQRLPALCHCQLGQDIPVKGIGCRVRVNDFRKINLKVLILVFVVTSNLEIRDL